MTRSAAAERFRAWVLATGPARPLVAFRVAFGAIWLVYDALDLATAGTARIHDWLGTDTPTPLALLQLGLILCEAAMVVGRPKRGMTWVLLAATVLRAAEWQLYLRLNDFAYCAVTTLLLAHVTATGGAFELRGMTTTSPRWPRDLLLKQAAWMYFATALLKTNPTWLSGKHLFVRLEYLQAIGWPYPAVVSRCAASLSCDAVLAWSGILAELTLACLLAFRPRRMLLAPVAIGVHAFGAFATNVWFFGPSLVAQVVLLGKGPLWPARGVAVVGGR